MPPIKFGTDGWRAVIADDYTFDNLERVTKATARWLKSQHGHQGGLQVVVGHDTRFLGRTFAQHAARVLAGEGIRVVLGRSFTSTPAVSWATRHYGCACGVVITASHNPPTYNGFKIKADFGGPATPDMIRQVEAELGDVQMGDLRPYEELENDGLIEERDITAGYLDMLRDSLDIEAIRSAGLKVAHDAMYGAGMGLVSALLDREQVVELHSTWNPGFMGQAPEPIEKNLEKLADVVVEQECAAGLANDGDADRIGMLDENGRFVSSHELLALLVKYLHDERGQTGAVVKTFSTTHLLDKMGEHYGLDVETTPIGFKYIAPRLVDGDVLVGGEESGGMAVMGHIPERDGIYIGLLILEMMVKRSKKLSELVQELFEQFGPHHTVRNDVHTTAERKDRAMRRLADEGGLDEIAGASVDEVQTQDGFKHLTENGWLLVRPSGTEPVLRVYAEAETEQAAQALVNDAMQQLGVADGHA